MPDLQGFGIQLLAGAQTTLQVALISLALGICLGLIGAFAKLAGNQVFRAIAGAYTTVIRGVPELLIILILYFGGTAGLSFLFGGYVEVDALTAGVSALTIIFGAYATEVFRSSYLAIPQGQIEAASALGLSRLQTFRLVSLPQMWRISLPAIGNLWLTLLKDTALISVVGLEDVMRKASIAATSTHDPLLFYSAAAVIYLALTTISLAFLKTREIRADRGMQCAG